MPAITRVGDQLATGHGCDGVTTLSDSAQDNTVFANSINIAVQGAPVAPHTIPGTGCVPHNGAVLNAGSSTVFINGTPVGRIGDSADAGAMIAGSGNVFAG